MDCFNDYDSAGLWSSYPPSSSWPAEVDPYEFLVQFSANEVANSTVDTFTDHWDMYDQPGPMVDLQEATTNHEPLASATSWVAQPGGDGQPSYSGQYWPTSDHHADPHGSWFPSMDDPFASTMGSGASAVVLGPSNGPLDYWGENQSGPSLATFYTQNVQSSYQPGTGPTRIGLIPRGRFQPYGTSGTHVDEYRNTEAGPSTLVPPPALYVGYPMPQPSGGISETTADADNDQTSTEENKAPTANRARRAPGQGPPRPERMQVKRDVARLLAWVQRHEGLTQAPSINEALAVAARIIPTVRPLVYENSCLRTVRGRQAATGSNHAMREFGRRSVERELIQDLSRYYPLGQGRNYWTRPSLLPLVIRDLEDLSPLPGPSNESDP